MIINLKLCPDNQGNHPNRNMAAIEYITIHCTGNYSYSATARAHANYQYNGSGGRQASWHYTVDKDEIWQSFEDNQMCWHAGTNDGNKQSIGIEICVNEPEGFIKACENTAWLTAELLKKHKLPRERVVQHFDWSGKNCPMELRSGVWGIKWNQFINMVDSRLISGAAANESAAAEVMALMKETGIHFDEAYWKDVLTGNVEANPEWIKVLSERLIDAQWQKNGFTPEKLNGILTALSKHPIP